jgi:hypothetical protein
MALYEVIRTDEPKAGEFVSAFVIAGGAAQARNAVAHLAGVVATGKRTNILAGKVDTTKRVQIISIYDDERAPDAAADYVTAFPGAHEAW